MEDHGGCSHLCSPKSAAKLHGRVKKSRTVEWFENCSRVPIYFSQLSAIKDPVGSVDSTRALTFSTTAVSDSICLCCSATADFNSAIVDFCFSTVRCSLRNSFSNIALTAS